MAIKLFHLVFLILLLLAPIGINAKRKTPSNKKSSAFDFIRKLKGCQKGNHTKEVHELKAYLERFGYLDKNHVDGDNFDEALESAVKTYQKNRHIEPSGIIDDETVSLMTTPRCGVPDIVNGTNYMQPRSSKKHNPSIHTVSHFSFFPNMNRWPATKTHLTYRFLPGFPPNYVDPVERAFLQWQNATFFSFSRSGNGQTSDLVIGFHRGGDGDTPPFRPFAGRAIAHAAAPTDGRFHFDAEEVWSVGQDANALHVESVAVHEIGHLLGLHHSEVRAASMFPEIGPGEVKNLNQDDINGIAALYGR